VHLVIIKKDGKVTANDAEVKTADQLASKGVVHIVDKVIMNENSVQKAVATPILSTLVLIGHRSIYSFGAKRRCLDCLSLRMPFRIC